MKKIIVLIFVLLIQNLGFAAELKTDYPLEKIVIFSRHNLRAPLNKEKLYKITPHKWTSRAEKSGELSSRGGELEILMGQYFKRWLEDEKFIPENYIPPKGETRFYANSVQRTIATARYFSAGMLPLANIEVEWRGKFNKTNPAFAYHSTELPVNKEFQNSFNKEYEAIRTERLNANIAESVNITEKILDFKNSSYAKENKIETFLLKDRELFTVSVDKHLSFSGAVIPLKEAADALVLEYYETDDDKSASFGNELTFEEWQKIGNLQSVGLYAIFHLPSLNKISAEPVIKEVYEELLSERKFSFLCGHDINLASMFSALGVEEYKLQDSVEPIIPIGSKFVIEKRRGKDGKVYAGLKLIYQNTKQIRNREPLTLKNPPSVVNLNLKGLKKNNDGLYPFDDVIERISSVLK